jgi:hypothetical protein
LFDLNLGREIKMADNPRLDCFRKYLLEQLIILFFQQISCNYAFDGFPRRLLRIQTKRMIDSRNGTPINTIHGTNVIVSINVL